MIPLLVLAIAPGIFVLWYFYHRDRYEPEPLTWVVKVFIYGALATVPAVLLELPFPEGFLSTVVAAPVIEESMKFLVVYLTVFRDREFDEPVDGIVYAVAAALGFATVENIFYVMGGGFETGVLRAFLSVPGHALFAVFWGYALGVAKFRPRSEWPVLLGGGIAGGILMHAAFNGLLFFGNIAGLVVVGIFVVPFGWWMAHRNIIRAENHPACAKFSKKGMSIEPLPQSPPSQKTCPECGSAVRSGARFCNQCGVEVRGMNEHPAGVQETNDGPGQSCPGCGKNIPEGSRYCIHCGSLQEGLKGHPDDGPLTCPVCGEEVTEGTRFCTGCGIDLQKAVKK